MKNELFVKKVKKNFLIASVNENFQDCTCRVIAESEETSLSHPDKFYCSFNNA